MVNFFKTSNKKRKQFENKKQENIVSEFSYSDAGGSSPALPFKGRNSIDLEFVCKQLGLHS